MEIKASSKYDWETVRALNNFYYLNRMRVIFVLFIVCFVLNLVIQIESLIVNGEMTHDHILNLIYLAFLAFALLFIIFVLPKIKYNNNKYSKDSKNEFVFTDENIKLTQTHELHNSENKLSYNAIWRIYESKMFIYMHIGRRQTYIVDKSTVTGGTVEDLRMLFISKIGAKKYKIKCKV